MAYIGVENPLFSLENVSVRGYLTQLQGKTESKIVCQKSIFSSSKKAFFSSIRFYFSGTGKMKCFFGVAVNFLRRRSEVPSTSK
jgi:hypothetical protein